MIDAGISVAIKPPSSVISFLANESGAPGPLYQSQTRTCSNQWLVINVAVSVVIIYGSVSNFMRIKSSRFMMPRTTNIAINNSWSRQNKTTGGARRGRVWSI